MGLMDILNGMQNGPRGQTKPGEGGMSPITMAMLALLAYKAYGKLTSGGEAQPQGAPSGRIPQGQPQPNQAQLDTPQGGGLGDLLGGLLGGAPNPRANPQASGTPVNMPPGGLGDLLGGLLGGGAAGNP